MCDAIATIIVAIITIIFSRKNNTWAEIDVMQKAKVVNSTYPFHYKSSLFLLSHCIVICLNTYLYFRTKIIMLTMLYLLHYY